jgi:hypothetical protein
MQQNSCGLLLPTTMGQAQNPIVHFYVSHSTHQFFNKSKHIHR